MIPQSETVSNTNIKNKEKWFVYCFTLRNHRDLMNTQDVATTLPLLATPVKGNIHTRLAENHTDDLGSDDDLEYRDGRVWSYVVDGVRYYNR
jgi:hypothetical protein